MAPSFSTISTRRLSGLLLWPPSSAGLLCCGSCSRMPSAPRSGKSRVLEVLEPLVRRGFAPGRATAAALMRITEKRKPTLLLDECDTYIVGDENLRNLLDNSFTISKATVWI